MAKQAKAGDGLTPDALTLARHSRALTQIRSLRAWAGIGGMALTIFLSLRAGVPTPDAWLRGLLGGLIAYMVIWAVAVTVWRQIALAQVETARRRMIATRRAAAERAAAALAKAASK
jgi:uncharacterized membrane protein YccC